MKRPAESVILGGGVCGLAAAQALGARASVFEQSHVAGGLVRSHRIGDYWFDWVIHLLHFPNSRIQDCIQTITGDLLVPCPPIAWIETLHGTAQFPIQHNLDALEPAVAKQCVDDLLHEAEHDDGSAPSNYEDLLRRTFGTTFCELFFFPYNRKMWHRPLSQLAPSGFQWNIARPDLTPKRDSKNINVYNKNGWYPRPAANANHRGMGVLSAALAAKCGDLRLNHRVESIDPEARRITVRHDNTVSDVEYTGRVLSTLPLNKLLQICVNAPHALRIACARLKFNRVRSVALCIEGPRPIDPGLWRYYTDERFLFTRLVFMNEFDPLMAPDNGWALLVETTERGEEAGISDSALIERIWADVGTCGILPTGCSLKAAEVLTAEPGYVVFEPGVDKIVAAAHAFLRAQGIDSLGRYGNWEYSSMAKVMEDGIDWALQQLSTSK